MSSRVRCLVTALVLCFATQTSAAESARTLPFSGGSTTRTMSGPEPSGDLLLNSDSSYENGFAWCYGGQALPDYGVLAECYEGAYEVSGIVVDLTYTGCQAAWAVDLYVWEDDEGEPGAVICVLADFGWLSPGFWPYVHRNIVDFGPCCTPERWWVGVWGDWPESCSCWYFGVDEDGPGGCPMTKIAPGQGYPSGWQPATIVEELADVKAFGIGAVGVPCGPVPTTDTSWGAIKQLYDR